MSRLLPTAGESSALRFLIPMPGLAARFSASGLLWLGGFSLSCLAESSLYRGLGFGMILAGHLPVWVRSLTTAPGGATPKHEDVWVPVEDAWLERVSGYERRGERWDTTPWDISNRPGAITLLVLVAVCAGVPTLLSLFLDSPALGRMARGTIFLLVPLWFNGMRTVWNPSELRRKGEALAIARSAAAESGKHDFEPVPMLALRRGARGSYPVDARLMMRPAQEDASGFLGVQFQVSINSVRGEDYPYFYGVILGRGEFRIPRVQVRGTVDRVDLVFERGDKEGVRFLVVRQHADSGGGWSTGPEQVRAIALEALRLGREARAANAGTP